MKRLPPLPVRVEDLRELVEFFAGVGSDFNTLIGGPITTYPDQQSGLHDACLRLEEARVVRRRDGGRRCDGGLFVVWEIEPELVLDEGDKDSA